MYLFLAKSHENDLKVYFLTVQRAAGENFLCLFFVIRISLIESSCFLCIFPRKYGFFDFHMYVFWIFEIPYVRKDTYVYEDGYLRGGLRVGWLGFLPAKFFWVLKSLWKCQKSKVWVLADRYWCPSFFLTSSEQKVRTVWVFLVEKVKSRYLHNQKELSLLIFFFGFFGDLHSLDSGFMERENQISTSLIRNE